MSECGAEIICPYCGNNEGDGCDLYEEHCNVYSDLECSKCGKEFQAMVEFHPYWYTKKKEVEQND